MTTKDLLHKIIPAVALLIAASALVLIFLPQKPEIIINFEWLLFLFVSFLNVKLEKKEEDKE